MQCAVHLDTQASGGCTRCGKFFCKDCLVDVAGRHLCRGCVSITFAEQANVSPAATVAASVAPAVVDNEPETVLFQGEFFQSQRFLRLTTSTTLTKATLTNQRLTLDIQKKNLGIFPKVPLRVERQVAQLRSVRVERVINWTVMVPGIIWTFLGLFAGVWPSLIGLLIIWLSISYNILIPDQIGQVVIPVQNKSSADGFVATLSNLLSQ